MRVLDCQKKAGGKGSSRCAVSAAVASLKLYRNHRVLYHSVDLGDLAELILDMDTKARTGVRLQDRS